MRQAQTGPFSGIKGPNPASKKPAKAAAGLFARKVNSINHMIHMMESAVPLWQIPTVLAQIQWAQYRKYSKYLKHPSHPGTACGRKSAVLNRQTTFSLAAPKSDEGGSSILFPRLGRFCLKIQPKPNRFPTEKGGVGFPLHLVLDLDLPLARVPKWCPSGRTQSGRTIFHFPKPVSSGMVRLVWESDAKRGSARSSFCSSMI
jgi:hypothetical protein